ncbi:MAG: hypothetical protein J6D03_10645 [Clostridia bacterium]|nr:hypothetical protein [Clostridia bacterium]
MDSRTIYLILKNTAKLETLINSNAPYEKILKQSKKLDKYIMLRMNGINKTRVSKN